MDALVSGSANVALLLDGSSVWSLNPSSAGVVRREIQPTELQRLFGESRDLTILEDVEEDAVLAELQCAHLSVEALQLALMLCDPNTSKQAVILATREFENFAVNDNIVERVECLLYARPLAFCFSAVFAEKRSLSVGADKSVRFFRALTRRQNTIREVRVAWDELPDNLFGGAERVIVDGILARGGIHRSLVCAWEVKSPIESWVESVLRNTVVLNLHGARQLIEAWVGRLQSLKQTTDTPNIKLSDNKAEDRTQNPESAGQSPGTKPGAVAPILKTRTGFDLAYSEALARRGAQGDTQARQQLIEYLWPHWLNWIRRRFNWRMQDTDDHVYDIAVDLVAKVGDKEGRALAQFLVWQEQHSDRNFEDWIRIVTTNAVKRAATRQRSYRSSRLLDEVSSSPRMFLNEYALSQTVDVQTATAHEATASELIEFAVGKLPVHQMQVLSLWLAGESYDEIALRLNLNAVTVKQLARAAIGVLRRHFNDSIDDVDI